MHTPTKQSSPPPQFSYRAFDANGRVTEGVIVAETHRDAISTLRGRGLFATELSSAASDAAVPRAAEIETGSWKWFAPRVSAREISRFTRQFSVLLRSGMPAVRGLEVLARQESNRTLRRVVQAIASEVRQGASISDAVSRHPKYFDHLFLNLVRAGEAAGALDVVLDRLARFSEKNLALKAKVRAAMTYPAVVLAVAVLILIGLMLFVVPRFQQIFADLLKGAPLPPLTQAVLSLSNAVKQQALLVAGSIALAAIGLRFALRNPLLREWTDAAILRLPGIGSLALRTNCARFTRTLGTLLTGGVPILESLRIARATTRNRRVASAIQQIHDGVKAGQSVARVVEATRVFPGMVASMIDVGEQTGQLGEMLARIADIYEEEVDRAAEGLSSLIEPFLILALATVVGTIVIALFLPIVRMVQLLS